MPVSHGIPVPNAWTLVGVADGDICLHQTGGQKGYTYISKGRYILISQLTYHLDYLHSILQDGLARLVIIRIQIVHAIAASGWHVFLRRGPG
jgi:hypothetical protein